MGDTLNRIVSAYYPKNVDLGLEAILLANPETINMDLITPGQKLTLPLINPDNQTIILRENQFYAGYGRYLSDAEPAKYSLPAESTGSTVSRDK